MIRWPASRKGDRKLSVEEEAVVWGYRLFLNREPENPGIVEQVASRLRSWKELRTHFGGSAEYLQAVAGMSRPSLGGHEPPMAIERVEDEATVARLLDHVAGAWTHMGKVEPHYSVITDPRFKPDRIGAYLEEFHASGRQSLARMHSALARNGLAPAKDAVVFELGCGVGRITHWLAAEAARVLAVDVSAHHLELARHHLQAGGVDNVELVRLERVEDIDKLPACDLFFSVIVLQHNPPPVIAAILGRAFARLRPGGSPISRCYLSRRLPFRARGLPRGKPRRPRHGDARAAAARGDAPGLGPRLRTGRSDRGHLHRHASRRDVEHVPAEEARRGMTCLPAPAKRKLGLVIDLDTCVGCHACAVACKEWNDGGDFGPLVDENTRGAEPFGVWFNRVHSYEVTRPATECGGEAPARAGATTMSVHFPRSCLHCETPAADGVSDRSELQAGRGRHRPRRRGQVHRLPALRLGVSVRRARVQRAPRHAEVHAVRRPHLQRDARRADRQPACVLAYPTHARHFGDLGDETSAVSRLVAERDGYALMPELGYRPVNRYLPPRPRRGRASPATPAPETLDRGQLPPVLRWLDRAVALNPPMRPALSILFFTTLSGAGYGLWFLCGLVLVHAGHPPCAFPCSSRWRPASCCHDRPAVFGRPSRQTVARLAR